MGLAKPSRTEADRRTGAQVRRGRPARAEARDIEQAILEAATDLFMKDGFAASMDGVAAAARVSKRTLYERYPSKTHLFEAVLTWLSGELAHPVALLDAQRPIEEELVRFSLALLDLYTRPKVSAFIQLMLGQADRFPEIEISHRRHFNEHILIPLNDYLVRALAGQRRDVDTMTAARMMCMIVTGEITRIFAEHDDVNRERFLIYIRSATEILLHGVRR